MHMPESTAILKFDLHKEHEKYKQLKDETGLYKNMARTYWDGNANYKTNDGNAYDHILWPSTMFDG